MDGSRLNRRDFLAALSVLGFAPESEGETIPIRLRKPSPYERYIPLIAADSDEFECERDATRLQKLLQLRDPGTRYYVLPGNTVRFEKKANGEYRVGHATFDWDGKEIRGLTTIWETVARAKEPLFRDITGSAFGSISSFREQLLHGIPYWRGRLDSATGIDVYGNNGIAVGDIDNDGWDEIYVCQPGGLPNRLYKRAANGSFEDITERAGVGVLDDTASALFVDFRNMGHQDLVVLRGSGPILFLNDGSGRFTPRPDAFRFRTPPQGTFTGMAAADYDCDGKVDLYLCCYVYFQSEDSYSYPTPYHDANNGPPNFLLANRLSRDGKGYFEDVTAESGIDQNNHRFSFAAAWCDFNSDGWPDLYVANDFGKNNLYRNDKGKFRDIAAESRVEDIGPGMSAAWFDYDGDGRPDLYVSNMYSDAGQRMVESTAFPLKQGDLSAAWHGHTKGNSLFRNRGDGTFEYTGETQRVEMGRWAWSADGHDFDNDGTPEIFVTCGMLTNTANVDLMSFFWRQVVAKSPADNQPSGEYENGWNAINQFIREDFGWHGNEPNVFYVRRGNVYEDHSGISGLDFAGDSRAFSVTDLDGDGKLDLLVKNRLGPQLRAFQNNCANNRGAIAFRLIGQKSNRDAIGATVTVDGQSKFVTAGSGFLSQHTKTLYFGLSERTTTKEVQINWPSGTVQSFEKLKAGFRYDIVEGTDAPAAIPFRDRNGQLAAEPMPKSFNVPRLEDTWLWEPVPLPDKRSGSGLFVLTTAEAQLGETSALYALFRRYLFDWRTNLDLPLYLLLDSAGRAIKIYKDRPEPSMIERDLAVSQHPLPFPGQYYNKPRRNYYKLGAAFYLAGYSEKSLLYFEEVLAQKRSNEKALSAVGQIHLTAGRVEVAQQYLSEALRVNPNSFDALINMGGVAFHREQYLDALKYYERAAQLRPTSAVASLNIGQAYAKLGDSVKAEGFLKKAAEADLRDPEPVNQLGLLAATNGRADDARRFFQQAIRIQRDYASAINNLGVLYQQVGQRNDAIAAFEYGITVAPGEDILYLNLARAYVTDGARDRAREVIRRWLVQQPDNETAKRALRDLEAR